MTTGRINQVTILVQADGDPYGGLRTLESLEETRDGFVHGKGSRQAEALSRAREEPAPRRVPLAGRPRAVQLTPSSFSRDGLPQPNDRAV